PAHRRARGELAEGRAAGAWRAVPRAQVALLARVGRAVPASGAGLERNGADGPCVRMAERPRHGDRRGSRLRAPCPERGAAPDPEDLTTALAVPGEGAIRDQSSMRFWVPGAF